MLVFTVSVNNDTLNDVKSLKLSGYSVVQPAFALNFYIFQRIYEFVVILTKNTSVSLTALID
jgi:hypothetical protein